MIVLTMLTKNDITDQHGKIFIPVEQPYLLEPETCETCHEKFKFVGSALKKDGTLQAMGACQCYYLTPVKLARIEPEADEPAVVDAKPQL